MMASEQRTPKFEYRIPISGSGRGMRKSASHEPLARNAISSEDGSPGGVRLSTLSLSPEKEIVPLDRRVRCRTPGMDPILRAAEFSSTTSDHDDVFADEHLAPRNSYSRIAPRSIHHLRDPLHPSLLGKDGRGKEVVLIENANQIDAQGIYPPTACIFVANLAQAYDDETLELEVTKHFCQFGRVFVKIRRDGNHMPFAFCQFTSDDDAQIAERHGKGVIILGRPCRTEMAKANVTFVVSRKTGGAIRPKEASELLQPLGEIAQVRYLDQATQESLHLPPAVLVSYKMYDAKRDVVRTFAKDRVYRVHPFDPRSISPEKAPSQREESRKLLGQYDKDRRSVFIGNLRPGTTEAEVINLAKICGQIASVQVLNKPVSGANGLVNCFAFVEFVRPDSTDKMILAYHEQKINGYLVRVERKQARSFETPRRVVSAQHSPYSESSVSRHRPGPGTDNLTSPLGRHTWSRSRAPHRSTILPNDSERSSNATSTPIKSSIGSMTGSSVAITDRLPGQEQHSVPLHSASQTPYGTHPQTLLPLYHNYFPFVNSFPLLETHNSLSQMTPQPSPGKICHEELARALDWNHYHNGASDCIIQAPSIIEGAGEPSGRAPLREERCHTDSFEDKEIEPSVE